MDIEGVGPSVVDGLLAVRLAEDPGDLYRLKQEDLEQMERMGEKSASNLAAAINDSKGRGLAKLLFGLGIRFLGAKGAELVTARFHTMDALIAASAEEIQETEGIGKVIAKSLYDYLHDVKNLAVINKLKDAGVLMEEVKETPAGQAFAGEWWFSQENSPPWEEEKQEKSLNSRAETPSPPLPTKPPWWWQERTQGANWKRPEQRISPSLMKKNF